MSLRTSPGSRPGLVTVHDIELCRVGTWDTSTGRFDFTLEDFASAIAAEADPDVFAAPVKIGHTDPRFRPRANQDGEPALGWVRNLHAAGDRLLGDLVDVPAKLAEIMPNALPRRSVEMGFQVHTPSGARYRAAVLGLALLGVQPPAVAGLADVIALYDGTTTFDVAAAAARCSGGIAYLVQDPAWTEARTALAALAARAGVGDQFVASAIDQLASMPPASSPILSSGPVTVGPHVVTSSPGGPQMPPMTDARVRQILALEESADADAALIALRDRASAAATAPPAAPPAPVTVPGMAPFIPQGWTPPAAAPPVVAPVAPAAVAPAVPPVPGQIPAGYQLVQGADGAYQLAPLAAVPPAPVAPPAPAAMAPATPPAPFVPGQPIGTPIAPAAPPAPVAPVAPAGDMTAQVAAAVAAQLQPLIAAAAAPGAQVAETMRVRDREAMLAAHARRGALRPTDVDYWRGQYDLNPTGTIAHLAAAPVSFPTFELGVTASTAASAEVTQEADRQFLAACGITVN